MITATSDKAELLAAIEEAFSQLHGLYTSLPESKVNAVPYEGSWTASQLMRHVTRSIDGMGKVMPMGGKPAERDPGERIPELSGIFLDFSKKMQSPDFIVPEAGPFERSTVIAGLDAAVESLKAGTHQANLTDLVEGLPFGPTTKLELLHFVLYHTQRHLHQLQRICGALQEA